MCHVAHRAGVLRLGRRPGIYVASDLLEGDHPPARAAGRRPYAELQRPERLKLREQQLLGASVRATATAATASPGCYAERSGL